MFFLLAKTVKCKAEKCVFQVTAVQLVYNPFSQIVSQLELNSQLQLILQSDPITLCVPIST